MTFIRKVSKGHNPVKKGEVMALFLCISSDDALCFVSSFMRRQYNHRLPQINADYHRLAGNQF